MKIPLTAVLVCFACAPSPRISIANDTLPLLRLPADTRPIAETVTLKIDPRQDRFFGKVDLAIALEQPRRVIWLHGKNLHVTRATVIPANGAPQIAVWQQRDDTGFASLTLPKPLSGQATLHLEYDAAFDSKLKGVHKITQAATPYIFTQFEAIAARTAFPCFDEPAFKIPFTLTLIVPKNDEAIANTHELDRQTSGDMREVHFAPTLPLPSYLVAFAVGPFDIVRGPDIAANSVRPQPLPLRYVTAKGHGKDIAYALAHTGEILATLEQLFGIAYPYDKLDIISVPDKGGAMENPGALTFGDFIVQFDDKTASLEQWRLYGQIMAHELAHQWVGDLVTAAWWDDIWLNEAFATWAAAKAADIWNPKTDASMQLLDDVQNAISQDGLVSARAIRQPIVTTDDIENAFDGITYDKGGGVLSMFERWVGAAAFQKGLHDYLTAHRFGVATAADFLDAESRAAGKDVQTPFNTFLDQPGVPFIQADVRCDGAPRLHLVQSRYLPLGSLGDANKVWQVPMCARYQSGKENQQACVLLASKEGELPLGKACPDWVMPNANADGYFRFSLAAADLAKLRKALPLLNARERKAYGNSLRAAFGRGTLPMSEVIEASAALAGDARANVATELMMFVGMARDWFYAEPLHTAVEAYGQRLFKEPYRKLGWQAQKNDDSDRVALRTRVIEFLTFVARDPETRAEAKKRALAFLGGDSGVLHPEAVDANLRDTALAVFGEDADAQAWNGLRALLARSEDAELRAALVLALSSSRRPELAAPIHALIFDSVLRNTETTTPLRVQLQAPETRQATWQWLKDNFDKLLLAMPKHHGDTQLIEMASVFCDAAHAQDAENFFTRRVARIEGGPRVLASTLEDIHLCAARRQAQEANARAFFAAQKVTSSGR